MRWSKLILSLGILSAASILGCRKDSSNNAAILPQNKLQSDQTPQPNMQSRTASGPRADDGTKVVISTPTQCYADLCQSNHELSLPELTSNAEKGSPEQREYYEKYINPMVIEAMKQRALSEKTVISLIQKYKDEFENLKLTEIQRRMFAVMYFQFKPDVINTKDRAKIERKLNQLPFSKALYASRIKGAATYLTEMHSGVGVQEAAQQEAHYIQDVRKRLKEATELDIPSTDSMALERALKSEKLNRRDLDTIATYGAYNRKIEALLLGDAHEDIDRLGYTEDDFYKTYKKAKLESESSDFNPAESAKCEASFYQSIKLAPTKDELEKFQTLKEQVKKASLSLLNQSDPAYAVVEKTDFYLPFNSEENVKMWRNGFKEAIRNSKKRMERDANLGVLESYLTAFVNALVETKQRGLCDNMYDPTLIDSITPEDGASQLSWMTVRYPKYGIGILSHEIGHVIAKHSKQFNSQIGCIGEQNSTDKYTAEDFADLIAIKTERNLEDAGFDLTDKKGNVGCLFASLIPSQGLINQKNDDIHSSHLFRAVKFALYRKQELPNSCKALARIESPNVLNSCDQ